jgi:hypothetical protein
MSPLDFDSGKIFPDFPFMPTELSCYIASFFDFKDLIRCELISKNWKVLAQTPYLWKHLYRNQFPEKRPITGNPDWKAEFLKSYPREKFRLMMEELSCCFIQLKDFRNKPLKKEDQDQYNELESKIASLQARLRLEPPHHILYFLFNDLIDRIPSFDDKQYHFKVTPEDMGDNPIMKGKCKENGRYVSLQIHTDKELKQKSTVTFVSWPKGPPHLKIFDPKLGMQTMISDYTIYYPYIFDAYLNLIRTGEAEAPSFYYKIV